MPDLLKEIQKILKNKSKKETKESFQRFVPTIQKVYGVKVPELNQLAQKYKIGGFELVEKLWQSGAFEEKLLASKILGKICKKDPELTFKLIRRFSKEIKNWAVCDTLATQGVRKIAKIKQKEIFEISRKLIKSKNFWQRRFAIVLLLNFKKDKPLRKKVKEIIKMAKKDKEYYVKKAIEWIEKNLS